MTPTPTGPDALAAYLQQMALTASCFAVAYPVALAKDFRLAAPPADARQPVTVTLEFDTVAQGVAFFNAARHLRASLTPGAGADRMGECPLDAVYRPSAPPV